MAAAPAARRSRSGAEARGTVSVVSTDLRLLDRDWSPQLERHRIRLAVAPAEELVRRAPECDVVLLPMAQGTAHSSLELVGRLVAAGPPILLSVQPGWEEPAAEALHRGARSFVVLPYRRTSLVRRLRLLAEPGPAAEPDRAGPVAIALDGGRILVDLRRREITVDGYPAPVPAREFDILRLLVERADQVVPAQEITTRLWPGGAGGSNSLAVHVRRLRERVEVDPSCPAVICTVRGVGYRLGGSARP